MELNSRVTAWVIGMEYLQSGFRVRCMLLQNSPGSSISIMSIGIDPFFQTCLSPMTPFLADLFNTWCPILLYSMTPFISFLWLPKDPTFSYFVFLNEWLFLLKMKSSPVMDSMWVGFQGVYFWYGTWILQIRTLDNGYIHSDTACPSFCTEFSFSMIAILIAILHPMTLIIQFVIPQCPLRRKLHNDSMFIPGVWPPILTNVHLIWMTHTLKMAHPHHFELSAHCSPGSLLSGRVTA